MCHIKGMKRILNDRSSALSLLLTRRSSKARDLKDPGPGPQELDQILTAASRVPDHGKLAPWRFVMIENREAFARLLLRLEKDHVAQGGKPDTEKLKSYASWAPTLIAVIFTPRDGPIPKWEQQYSVGAAIQNLLLATHALGYAGCWLTGAPSVLPGLEAGLGVPEGKIAGFLFLGTPAMQPDERPRPPLETVVSHWPAVSEP